MSVSCSIWHHGLAGSFEMNESEFEELKQICEGTPVKVQQAFVTKKKWRQHQLPFGHVKSLVLNILATPPKRRKPLYDNNELFTPPPEDFFLTEPMERHEDVG
jgi:hypothetical protein